jgi:D-3-phosphoglycerate dehydrogenase / 2-oxoglutarate reductase
MAEKLKVAISVSSFGEAETKPLQIIEQAGLEIVPNPFKRRLTEDEIVDFLPGVHGLIAGLEPLNAKVLESALHLKALARVGIGMDNVDFGAANRLGIKVSNTPDGPTAAVAESVVTCLLSLLRHLPKVNDEMHQGIWKKRLGLSIKDLTITIVGYGRIGREVAKLLSLFGANIQIVDPFLPKDFESPYNCLNLEEALASSDVLSLHSSGSDEIIGSEEFSRLKKGSYLLNAARGSLIDENALVSAIDSGIIAGAWIDTFRNEPYRGPLKNYPQVILTPHLATYTRQCRLSMELEAAQNLIRDLGL